LLAGHSSSAAVFSSEEVSAGEDMDIWFIMRCARIWRALVKMFFCAPLPPRKAGEMRGTVATVRNPRGSAKAAAAGFRRADNDDADEAITADRATIGKSMKTLVLNANFDAKGIVGNECLLCACVCVYEWE